MRTQSDIFVSGSWQPSHGSDSYAVVNPATEEQYASITISDDVDVDRAVEAAKNAFDLGLWRRTSIEDRCEALLRVRDLLVSWTDRIADEISSTLGQPLAQARGLGNSAGLIDMYVSSVRSLHFEYLRSDAMGTSLITRQPVGVVAGISPWNTPLRSEVKKAVPALLAGCSVVLKPAPETPFGAVVLADAVAQAGIPAGVFNVVFGAGATGEALVSHPKVNKVSFTGSTATGSRIGKICGETFKRVELELGGKSAAVVLDDADMNIALECISRGNFGLSGQACIGLTRILAPRSRYDEVVAGLVERATALRVGNPFDEATTMGPLVSQNQRERVLRYIDIGKSEGGTLVTGGGRPSSLSKGWFVEPTVFAGVSNDMTIAREEIFGPVASVIPYDDEDEAIAIANDSVYGLHGAVFSTDELHALDVAQRMETGSVGVNSYGPMVSAPFGGVKSSGIGREHGPEGFDALLEFVPYGVSSALAAQLSARGVHTAPRI